MNPSEFTPAESIDIALLPLFVMTSCRFRVWPTGFFLPKSTVVVLKVILNSAASALPLQLSWLSPIAGVVETGMFSGLKVPTAVGLKATVTSTDSPGESTTGKRV